MTYKRKHKIIVNIFTKGVSIGSVSFGAMYFYKVDLC